MLEKIINPRWPPFENLMQFLYHMTSPTHVTDLKETCFGLTICPLSFVFMTLNTRGVKEWGRNPPYPRPRRSNNGLNWVKDHPQVFKQYDYVIKEKLESGVVELVTQDQVPELGNVHYLPDRGVVRLDRDTTEVRVVYNASVQSIWT